RRAKKTSSNPRLRCDGGGGSSAHISPLGKGLNPRRRATIGRPPMPDAPYLPGTPIPGTVYKVVRHLATGGMGTVYDVEDTTVGRRYVLKTLHPELCGRKDLAKRMSDEARMLARLAHPNIVEVFTAGVTADELKLPYYVME